MYNFDETTLESVLQSDNGLTEGQWSVLDAAADHYNHVLSISDENWGSDVIEHCISQLTRMENRLDHSIAVKTRPAHAKLRLVRA